MTTVAAAFRTDSDAYSKRVLGALEDAVSRLKELDRARHEPIAIVGIGCRFPGKANDLESFQQLLFSRGDAIGRVPASRWDADAFYDADFAKPGRMYVREGAFLDRIEDFDAEFFGISHREAMSLDPQHRILLEVSWEALENAGIRPSTLEGTPTGVFIGITCSDYARRLAREDYATDRLAFCHWQHAKRLGRSHFLLPRSARAESRYRHRLLLITGCGAPSLSELTRGRM